MWPAFLIFESLRTQWRSGNSGVYGLDYNVMYHKLDRLSLERDEYDRMEADLRVMEDAALAEIHKGK